MNQIIEERQAVILIFGLQTTIYRIMHLSVALLLGILFGRVWDIIIFHIFYQKIRTYAGGHHARSNTVCFICSCLMAVVTLSYWKFCPKEYSLIFIVIFLVFSVPIIWHLSPLGDVNKILDSTEKRVYRKKTRVLLVIELSVAILLIFTGSNSVALIISTALLTLCFMLLLEKGKCIQCFQNVGKCKTN